MLYLCFIGCKQFLIGPIICSCPGFQTDLFAGPLIESVVQGQFQNFRQIKIAGKDISFGTESPGFHTSRAPAVPGIADIFSRPQHFLYQSIRIEHRRLTEAGFDDFDSSPDKTVRIFLTDLNHRTGLQ